MPKRLKRIFKFKNPNEIDFSATWLNKGSTRKTIESANKSEIKDTNNDSPINWAINCGRKAPTVFRNPTSFAR